MPDLIEKYFKEDLTEAEDQALEELLATSEEGAERLVATAEKAYYRYGFPTPHLPGAPGASSEGGSFFKPWMILLALGVAAVLLLWRAPGTGLGEKIAFLKDATMTRFGGSTLTPEGAPSTRPVSNNKGPKKLAPMDASTQTFPAEKPVPDASSQGKAPAGEMGKRTSPVDREPIAPVQNVQTQQIVTPFNLEESPSRKYSGISVEVKRSEPGQVAVRVLDMSGLEVTPLFNGNLATGRWIFEWDGQLGNGSHVKPGYYQVEVRSGFYVGRKNIHIK